jgi:hypothetical protein
MIPLFPSSHPPAPPHIFYLTPLSSPSVILWGMTTTATGGFGRLTLGRRPVELRSGAATAGAAAAAPPPGAAGAAAAGAALPKARPPPKPPGLAAPNPPALPRPDGAPNVGLLPPPSPSLSLLFIALTTPLPPLPRTHRPLLAEHLALLSSSTKLENFQSKPCQAVLVSHRQKLLDSGSGHLTLAIFERNKLPQPLPAAARKDGQRGALAGEEEED